MKANKYKRELDFIKTKYPGADETDKSGTINGNFWIGIAKLLNEYASTPTRQVSDEANKRFIENYEFDVSELSDKPDMKVIASSRVAKWLRDQAPITTSLPSEDQIMKELLDRWGFAEDGAVDCGEQLKIFSFMKWLKSLSSTREGAEPPKN